MHPEEIKAAMRIAGTTPAMLCDELHVAASSVSQTISGHIRSKRIQTRIAEIIGRPIDAIWPNQVVLRRSREQVAAQKAKASSSAPNVGVTKRSVVRKSSVRETGGKVYA
ncbi:hypothetical protein D3C71_1553850 [compost metagenome]